jgi:hypothetical protein
MGLGGGVGLGRKVDGEDERDGVGKGREGVIELV